MRKGAGLRVGRVVGSAPSGREMMAVVLAREIRDGEIGSPGGANSEVPQAAIRLAQLSHAPNASFITSASGFVCNLSGKNVPPLRGSTTDYAAIRGGAEAIVDWPFVLASHRDFFFCGGLQVDLHGNLNLIGVGGRYPRLKLRGPGTAGIGQASVLADRFYIYLGEHSPRSLVTRVEYVSALGHPRPDPQRDELGVAGGGPRLVVTPLAVLAFGPKWTLCLASRHPGVDADRLLEATPAAFHPPDPAALPETPAPTPGELALLRERVDPHGLLRR